MKINELLMAIHRKDFNMEKELQVKKYLPIEEKKLIAQGILYESTEEVNGVVKVDSVQRYLSYVKYMIIRHTNLEYTHADYDQLCSNEYNGMTLLNAIMKCFGDDATECSRILNLVVDDFNQEQSVEHMVSKFLGTLSNAIGGLSEVVNNKLNEFNLADMLPADFDGNKMSQFLEQYVK